MLMENLEFMRLFQEKFILAEDNIYYFLKQEYGVGWWRCKQITDTDFRRMSIIAKGIRLTFRTIKKIAPETIANIGVRLKKD